VHDTLCIGGHRVSLRAIRQPVLNLYALEDHIVPASASMALRDCIGSHDYTACAVPTGHIGMYVSRAAGAEVPARIISWLTQRS
jgi:polyhydroxyalkanoate synthase subunit PhaC